MFIGLLRTSQRSAQSNTLLVQWSGPKMDLLNMPHKVELADLPILQTKETSKLYWDKGSIHLSAEISFLAESFGTVPKLWLRILARKNLPKLLAWNFMPKFRAEILSQNTSTVPKLLAQNFGIEKTCRNFWLKNHAKISCRKNRLETVFRRTEV